MFLGRIFLVIDYTRGVKIWGEKLQVRRHYNYFYDYKCFNIAKYE